jgi:hypothetical protein
MLQVTGSPFLIRFKITPSRRTGGHCTASDRMSRTLANVGKKKTEGRVHGRVDQILADVRPRIPATLIDLG